MLQQKFKQSKLETTKRQRNEAALTARLSKKYREKSYSETWSTTYRATSYASYVFNAFSFMTGAFAIFSFLYVNILFLPKTIAAVISIGLSIFVAVVVEVMKRNTTSNFFTKKIFCGEFKPSYFFSMLLLCSLSIGLSFYGSTKVPVTVTQAPQAPTPILQDLQSIEADYNGQISNLQKQIDDIREDAPRWKGVLTGDSQETINSLMVKIAALQDQKNEATAAARAHNLQATTAAQDKHEQQLVQHKSKMEGLGSVLGYISLCTELFFLLCFLIMETYLDRCALERGMVHGTNQAPTPLEQQQKQQQLVQGADNNQVQPIHHAQPEPAKDFTQDQQPAAAPPINAPARVVIKPFSYTRDDQQSTQVEKKQDTAYTQRIHRKAEATAQVATTDLQKQIRDVYKNLYIHRKEDGTTVKMTKATVKSRIKQYNNRVEKWQTKGSLTQLQKRYYATALEGLEYWEQALEKLKANEGNAERNTN